jgi:acyl carrier protein
MPVDKDKVLKNIARQFSKNVNKIDLKASFFDDMGADSIDFIEFIMNLEDTFKITISDSDAEKFKTPQDVIIYLDQHIIPPNSLE